MVILFTAAGIAFLVMGAVVGYAAAVLGLHAGKLSLRNRFSLWRLGRRLKTELLDLSKLPRE